MKLRKVIACVVLLASSCGAAPAPESSFAWSWTTLFANDGRRIIATMGEQSGLFNMQAIHIYDVVAGRETGSIAVAPREDKRLNGLQPLSLSPDGKKLLLLRFSPPNVISTEAWEIEALPHLEWQTKGNQIIDARWVEGQIVVLKEDHIEFWSERGVLQRRVALDKKGLRNGTSPGALSPDASRAVLGLKGAVFDAKNGKMLYELPNPGGAYEFGFSPDSQLVWSWGEACLDSDCVGGPADTYGLWRLRDAHSLWKDPLSGGGTTFSSDSRRLWAGSHNQWFDIEKGTFSDETPFKKVISPVEWFTVLPSPDEQTLAGTNRHRVWIVSRGAGELKEWVLQ